MIYVEKYLEMTTSLDIYGICYYLETTNWLNVSFKRKNVKVYQYVDDEIFEQVYVPLNKEFSDYKRIMYETIQTIAKVEKVSFEQVFLFLLNPDNDVLRIRFNKRNEKPGLIILNEAVSLFENVNRLITYTAADLITPKKSHNGRLDKKVQCFINQCRFVQTEIVEGEIVIDCPFVDIFDSGSIEQLDSIIDAERCSSSLTRRVINSLLDSVAIIKQKIDEDNIDELVSENCKISSNFLEALNGLYSCLADASVEFVPEWSPYVKENRSENIHATINHKYCQSIENVIKKIKSTKTEKKTITGRIIQLSASPIADNRKDGKIVVQFNSKNNKLKKVSVKLSNDEYQKAVKAHQLGKRVSLEGDLSGKEKLTMTNFKFSVMD